ncbi:hypothetical protein RI367_005708 [Sorochytrium milnesiophthora]
MAAHSAEHQQQQQPVRPSSAVPASQQPPVQENVLKDKATTVEHLYAKYELGDTIGTGAFSEVKRGTDRQTGRHCAVKIIDKAKCRGKEHMIQSEVAILKRVRHKNIIRLHEMYESPTKIFLIMELVTGGELFDRIVERNHYSEKDAAKLVYDILLGVEYLHEMGICHRDLKPENLLFATADSEAHIMISDFGLSKIFSDVEVMKTACGTPGYVAPEVLRRQGYNKQVDMWSIGVITYILLCGYPPFYEENNTDLFNQIMRGHYEFDSPYWDNISYEAKNFVSRMLVVDPARRITTKEALMHPFIVDNCAEAKAAKAMSELRLTEAKRKAESGSGAAARAVARIGSIGSSNGGSASTFTKEASDPQLHPLRPKSAHTEVEDSGIVASTQDVKATVTASESLAPAEHAHQQQRQHRSPHAATGGKPGHGKYSITPPQAPLPMPIVRTETDTVRVLSYNIFMRPPGVKNNTSDYKNDRLSHFCDHHMSRYDLLCLQEMFAYGSGRLQKLISQGQEHGLTYCVSCPSKGLLNGTVDGGLVILSRFPIIKQAKMTFKKWAYNDRFIAKGALYARVMITGHTTNQIVHVFTTNLQSTYTPGLQLTDPEVLVRLNQVAQLRQFILQQTHDKKPYEPILIMGDLNINARPDVPAAHADSEEYQLMLRILRGESVVPPGADPQCLESYPPVTLSRKGVAPRDLLKERYRGQHPVTYADVDAETGAPVETALTRKDDQGQCHSTDYILWCDAEQPRADGRTVKVDLSQVKVEPMRAQQGQHAEFTHLSEMEEYRSTQATSSASGALLQLQQDGEEGGQWPAAMGGAALHEHLSPDDDSATAAAIAAGEDATDLRRRRRLTKACDLCRRRKIRCDGECPCGPCRKQGITDCTYRVVSKKRGPREGYMHRLEKRLNELEQKLVQDGGSSSNAVALPVSPGVAPSENSVTDSGGGMMLLEPGEPLARHLIDLFIAHLMEPCCNITPAYHLQLDFESGKLSPSVLYAVFALSALFSRHPVLLERFGDNMTASVYFRNDAKSMVNAESDCTSNNKILTLCLLACGEFLTGNVVEGWMYNGMALRSGEILFVPQEEEALLGGLIDMREKDALDLIMLTAFCQNVAACCASGRSICLSDMLIAATDAASRRLAGYMASYQNGPISPVEHCILPTEAYNTLPMPTRFHTVQLFIIMARILQLVNAPFDYDATNPGRITTLHNMLMDFRASCPDLAGPWSPEMNAPLLSLAFRQLFYMCMIVLHRPAALEAYRSCSTATSFSAQQSLVAAEQILAMAEYMTRRTSPMAAYPLTSYVMLTAASVYIHRSISAPLTTGDVSKLQLLLSTMETAQPAWSLADKHAFIVQTFMQSVRQGKHADIIVLAAQHPRVFSRSDAGWSSYIKYALLKSKGAPLWDKASDSGLRHGNVLPSAPAPSSSTSAAEAPSSSYDPFTAPHHQTGCSSSWTSTPAIPPPPPLSSSSMPPPHSHNAPR